MDLTLRAIGVPDQQIRIRIDSKPPLSEHLPIATNPMPNAIGGQSPLTTEEEYFRRRDSELIEQMRTRAGAQQKP
jgi:hypothetical protein